MSGEVKYKQGRKGEVRRRVRGLLTVVPLEKKNKKGRQTKKKRGVAPPKKNVRVIAAVSAVPKVSRRSRNRIINKDGESDRYATVG